MPCRHMSNVYVTLLLNPPPREEDLLSLRSNYVNLNFFYMTSFDVGHAFEEGVDE